MQNYLLRRLLITIPTLFGISVLIFLIMRVLPGDPTTVMFGADGFGQLSEADRARFRESLGLEKPLIEQYLDWVAAVVRGDLGESFWRKDKVMDLFMKRAPITAEIALLAIVLSWVIGVPAGIISATQRNSWTDYISRFVATIFIAIPNFWLGVVVVLVGVLVFGWRPPIEVAYLTTDPGRNLQIVIGPAIALGMGAAAYVARMTRSAMLEILHEDYVRTAYSKGLRARLVLWRHVFRNAVLSVVTVSGLILGGMLGGSVAVEQAFGAPGLGTALLRALLDRDYMVIQNLVLLYGIIFAVVNLAVDLAYGWLDPRIRLS